jgi:hypothetical protein
MASIFAADSSIYFVGVSGTGGKKRVKADGSKQT